MKVILGLGNPGLRYRFSRHNIGFLVVERLAKQNAIKINQRVFKCLVGKGSLANEAVFLALPLTFMNLSGEAVASIVKHKKIRPADLLIVLDDINLPLGKLRIRAKGSEGGHKGLGSIIKALGREDFARLRVGVGRAEGELTEHILGRFKKKEIKIINEAMEKAANCCEVWVRDGIVKAMSKFN